mgnify:FL=1
MKIRRELKYATFEWDDEEKSITIETRSHEPLRADSETHPVNGRIKLNKVYAFSLMRFVVRIAQRNWFRKIK